MRHLPFFSGAYSPSLLRQDPNSYTDPLWLPLPIDCCEVPDVTPECLHADLEGFTNHPQNTLDQGGVTNGDWTYQLLVLLETPPRRGLTYSCQVEHVSLEQPLSRHWEMPPDAARSKMLTGIGGFVLGFVFLALGLGFYVRKKSS
ncbi:class II histocompatibility antigen, B-L beta chain-like [Molothrus ater]|uniref:class II histocompatibility antigen, B-L beta chain-like n=1 Tax=Molothrus ater TaxID=84834 RepID=UPI00174B7744|nr:class II histocompatibility antigen, B-L beta chain-like [Molothrus ater]